VGIVQHQRQVVEGDDHVQVVSENLEQFPHRAVGGKRLGDAKQRVVARQVCDRECGGIFH
jgi:hypothetical protein